MMIPELFEIIKIIVIKQRDRLNVDLMFAQVNTKRVA